jgi:hypothetical protein
MPWYDEATQGKWPAAVRSFRLLVDQARWTVLLLAALAVAGGGEAGGPRAWLRRRPWLLLALVGLVGVPMAVIGGAKVGGYLNTHSVTNYFLTGAATCGLAQLAAGGRLVPRALLAALLAVFAATYLGSAPRRAEAGPAVRRFVAWRADAQEQAFAFARAHPGAVVLPWNPLVTLLADGQLWNNEIGAWNRDLAGETVTDAQWRRWLPPDARWLAFRPARGAFVHLPSPTGRLPEYVRPVQLPELDGWIVLEAAPRTPGVP